MFRPKPKPKPIKLPPIKNGCQPVYTGAWDNAR